MAPLPCFQGNSHGPMALKVRQKFPSLTGIGPWMALPSTILAEIITKEFLGTISFVMIFVIITKITPPEDFLCNVAATGGSLFTRK